MSSSSSNYELPKGIDRYLAALSKLYAHEGKRQLQELIVNAQTRVHEGWSGDNLNGGTYGHAVYIAVPAALYSFSVKQKRDLQNSTSQPN